MSPEQISKQLSGIASEDDFAYRADVLVDEWLAAGVGPELVEPILRFIEEHPDIDYGMPGPLTHFVEKYYRKGYEAKLIESIRRRPTFATVWMLNRIINGTKADSEKQMFIAEMEKAKVHPRMDSDALAQVRVFFD